MKAVRMLAFACLGALLAGCVPPPPPVSAPRSTPNADPASYTPGEAPKFGYQVDYSFKVEAGYDSHEWTDPSGEQYGGLKTGNLRVEWYPDGVQGDGVPYALQSYMQRSAVLKLGVGFGDLEHNNLAQAPFDLQAFEAGGAVFAESGLGVRFDTRYAKARTAVTLTEDYTVDAIEAALVWQDENGFAVGLEFNKTAAHIYEEASMLDGLLSFPAHARRGWGVDVRKVWIFDNGGGIDLQVGLEFAKYDMLDVWDLDKDGAVVAGLGLSFYPVKPFGFGFLIERVDFFSNETVVLFGLDIHDLDHTAYGFHVTFTLAERVDVSASFMTWSNDIAAVGPLDDEIKENDIVRVALGVRF